MRPFSLRRFWAAAAGLAVVASLASLPASAVPGTETQTAAVPASWANVVLNGTFETGVQGWRTNDKARQRLVQSSPGRASDGAAQLTSSTGARVVLNDQVNSVTDAVEGQPVEVSAWVRAAESGLSGRLRLREVVDGTAVAVARTPFRLEDTSWTQVTLSHVVARSGADLDLNVVAFRVATGQSLQVDDVTVAVPTDQRPGPTATPTNSSESPTPTQQPTPTQSSSLPTATQSTTATATQSPKPTSTSTATPSQSSTPKPTATATASQSPTSTPTASQSATPTPTQSPRPTTPPTCGRASFPGDPSCTGKLYYGASVEGGDPATLERLTGAKLGLFRSYMQSSTPASKFVSRASSDLSNGRVPLISTKAPGSWGEVAAGQHDGWLLDRIRGLAALNGPVWLALHHEPANDGAPADWVAMQQRARQLIDANSDNIALVGILNGWELRKRNGDPQVWNHPVGSGVHVMGFDTYNGWSPTNGQRWVPAAEALAPGVEIAGWGYPTLIGEYGVRTDPANPGRAAQWLRDAYAFAADHGFVAMSYFNSGANSPDGTWVLDAERLPVFRANLGGPDSAFL